MYEPKKWQRATVDPAAPYQLPVVSPVMPLNDDTDSVRPAATTQPCVAVDNSPVMPVMTTPSLSSKSNLTPASGEPLTVPKNGAVTVSPRTPLMSRAPPVPPVPLPSNLQFVNAWSVLPPAN